jgi:hypothetical protein
MKTIDIGCDGNCGDTENADGTISRISESWSASISKYLTAIVLMLAA